MYFLMKKKQIKFNCKYFEVDKQLKSKRLIIKKKKKYNVSPVESNFQTKAE